MLTTGGGDLDVIMTEGSSDTAAVSHSIAALGVEILLVKPGAKEPWDLRTPRQRTLDDNAGRRGGQPSATTSKSRLTGFFERARETGMVPNVAISLGPPEEGREVRLVLVDADQASETAAVQALAAAVPPESYPPTTATPGARNASGDWVHSGGGHFVYEVDVPDLPYAKEFKLDGGAVVSTHSRYFLIPPSKRPEGAYKNVGPVRALSSAPWLVEAIRAEAAANGAVAAERARKADEREEQRESGDSDGAFHSSLEAWHAANPWDKVLGERGWTPRRSQPMDCGCRRWNAPDKTSGTAVAHDAGCTKYDEVDGAWPIHVWSTDAPGGLEGGGTYTRSSFVAAVDHGGDMAAFLRAAGIASEPEPYLDPSVFAMPEFAGVTGRPTPSEGRNDPLGPHDPALLAEVFGYSPVTAHILEQARARMIGPWAALLVALVHAVVLTPWQVRLPALVGGEASTNMLVALVGGSGAGKGVSTSTAPIIEWASDPLDPRPAFDGTDQDAATALVPRTPGSGEAIATLFRDWRTIETADDKGKVTRTLKLVTVARAAWMDFPEVDQVSALMRRESSTLSSELRKVWDGRQLGVHTKSKERRSEVPAFTYRAAVTIGVQPERADGLLSGEDGGLPQRIVWAATDDPGLGDEDDTPLASWSVASPPWQLDEDRIVWMDVADPIRAEIRRDRRRVLRKEPGALVGIDAHRNLVRLKLAAAVAVLHSRTGVTENDWHLADLILTHSDRVRADVQRTLATAVTASHEARGAADAARDRGARRTRDDEIGKAAASVHGWLANRKGRAFTASQIRAASKTGSARHTWCAEALAVLTDEGSVGPDGVSRTGTTAYTWTSDREGLS